MAAIRTALCRSHADPSEDLTTQDEVLNRLHDIISENNPIRVGVRSEAWASRERTILMLSVPGDVQEIPGGGRATVTRMGRDPRPEAGRGSGARPMHSRAIGRGPGRHGRGRPRKSERLNSCSGNVSSLNDFGQHIPDRNPSLGDPGRVKTPEVRSRRGILF